MAQDFGSQQLPVFQIVGPAPFEVPSHPARLAPVRDLVAAGSGRGAGSHRSYAWHGDGGEDARSVDGRDGEPGRHEAAGEGLETAIGQRGLPRTFSASCLEVLAGQAPLDTFSAEQVYKACSFFNACSTRFIRELVDAGGAEARRGTSYVANATIYSEGEVGSSMFIIRCGTAEMTSSSAETLTLGARNYFGETNALGSAPQRLETVRALSPLHVFEVSGNVLSRLLKARAVEKQASVLGTTLRTEGNSYVFATERHHFEREAGRLYLAAKRRKGCIEARKVNEAQQGESVCSSDVSSPAHFRKDFHSAVSSIPVSRDMSRIPTLDRVDHPPSPVVAKVVSMLEHLSPPVSRRASNEGRGSLASCGHASSSPPPVVVHLNAGATPRSPSSPSSRHGRRRSGSPRAQVQTAISPRRAQLRSEAIAVNGQENPRQWRLATQQMQAKLLKGECRDGTQGLERMMQSLKESIRADVKQGCVLPAAAAERVQEEAASRHRALEKQAEERRNRRLCHSGGRTPAKASIPRATLKVKSSQMSAASVQDTRVSVSGVSPPDQVAAQAQGVSQEKHTLSLELLPDLTCMCPEQKFVLLQNLAQIKKARLQRKTKAVKTLSSIMSRQKPRDVRQSHVNLTLELPSSRRGSAGSEEKGVQVVFFTGPPLLPQTARSFSAGFSSALQASTTDRPRSARGKAQAVS